MTSLPDSPRLRRVAATALALAAGALAVAPAAQADSIAYIKGGDVWLSTADGSRQYQVTSGGGYSTVSQSDAGTIVALYGDRIRTLDRVTGAVRYDIRTPASSSFPGTQFRGPFDPAISPGGQRIAYTWYYTQYSETPSCNPSTGCQTVYGRQGTGYTAPDHITGFDDPGYKSQSGWVSPSWIGDDATLISDPIQVGNPQVAFNTPGSDQVPGAILPWFNDGAARGLRDGELSNDHHKFVFVSGDANEKIHFYRSNGDYPNIPDACYGLSGGQGRYQSPSWSPDSTRVAFADDAGISVIPIPDQSTDCGVPTQTEPTLLIPGAAYPDWGPADVPPARVVTAPPAPPAPGPGSDNGNNPKNGGGAKSGGNGNGGAKAGDGGSTSTLDRATLTVSAKTRLGAALRKGLTIKLAHAASGRMAVSARSGRTTVASGTAKVGAKGTATVTLKFSSKGKRLLKGQRSVKLTISGGGARTTVTLKR